MQSPLSAAALSLRQLAYFAVLAETLHFTRAAERCFVTQSTLSAGIRELEEMVGAPLFERDRQTVRLAPAGAALLPRARELLSAAGDFLETARVAADPLGGTITLGAIPTVAPFLLPGLLRALRREHPSLRVVLREERTQTLVEETARGELDFALIALPVDVGDLQATPLFTEELWLITAVADPLAQGAQPRLAQVEMDQLLLLGEGHCLREHSLQACARGRRGRQEHASSVEASSLPTLVQMVEAGMGVSLLPEMAVKAGFLDRSRVVARPLAAPAPRREIALVARATQPRTELRDRLCALASLAGAGATPKVPRRSRVARASRAA